MRKGWFVVILGYVAPTGLCLSLRKHCYNHFAPNGAHLEVESLTSFQYHHLTFIQTYS